MRVEEAPDPKPGPGEVLVRVKAAGLNFADILARQGLYPDGPPKPCVMGYEAAGIVEDVGEGVDRNLMGKAVIAMTRFKGQAELLVVSAAQVFAKPDSLTFEASRRNSGELLNGLGAARDDGRSQERRSRPDS